MHIVTETLNKWLSTLPPQYKLLVAFSGGRDSRVLLHALNALKPRFSYTLSAVHVNHGLQALAQDWALAVTKICEEYDIPLEVLTLSVKILPGESLEEKARVHRYKAMASLVDENTYLLTAHSEDDQAETFLLQMMRGSGIKGLAGIAPIKPFAKGKLARPLLTLSRENIAEYAALHNLSWIEDPSNLQLHLRRNAIRQQLLKPLNDIQPNTTRCIARSALHCQAALGVLNGYLEQEVADCLGAFPKTLTVPKLKLRDVQKQAFILRHWLSTHQVTLPNFAKCQTMLHQLLFAKKEANPMISWGNWELRRYQELIYLLPLKKSVDNKKTYDWDLQQPIILEDGQCWRAALVKGKGLSKSKLNNKPIRIAYRQGGERCYLDKQQNSKALKKILHAVQIPPWERKTLPLFYYEETLVGVAGLLITKGWQVEQADEDGYCFEKL